MHRRQNLDVVISNDSIPPRLGEQDPKQAIARAEVRTSDRAPENDQLLTQRHVLERDGSVSTTEQLRGCYLVSRWRRNRQQGRFIMRACRFRPFGGRLGMCDWGHRTDGERF